MTGNGFHEQTLLSGPRERPAAWPYLLAAVLTFVVVLEVFTRTYLFRASADFARFRSYPAHAARLACSPGTTVAFIGNSATNMGVDPGVFVAAAPPDLPVAADKFSADDSRINTWYYLLNRYFWSADRHPDTAVIVFFDRQLADSQEIDIGRLAQFFTTPRDWPGVFRYDLRQPGERVEFVTDSLWATFAARDRLRERILGLITPGYQRYIRSVNAMEYAHEGPGSSAQERGQGPFPGKDTSPGQGASSGQDASAGRIASSGPSYRTLDRLLFAANEHHTRLIFVAFPVQSRGPGPAYGLDPEALDRIRSAGMLFLDLRGKGGLQPADYLDGIHLNDRGRGIFSRYLAGALAPLLREQRAAGGSGAAGLTGGAPGTSAATRRDGQKEAKNEGQSR